MKGDVSGVRITPNKINFLDTQINTVYTVNITVKNISTISKSIRYYAPQTKVMCLYCLYLLFGAAVLFIGLFKLLGLCLIELWAVL